MPSDSGRRDPSRETLFGRRAHFVDRPSLVHRLTRRLPAPGMQFGMMGAFGDYVVSYAWFLGLQLIDLMSTLVVLEHGGAEGNAKAAWAMAAWGPEALLGTKLALIVLTLLVWVPAAGWLDARREGNQFWAYRVVNILVLSAALYYSAIVFYNLANLAVLLG